MIWVIVIVVFVALGFAAFLAEGAKERTLRAAPSGSTRVETKKGIAVNQTVQLYAKAGWKLEDQSASKSFGTQPRVTLMFRKP